MMMDRGKTGYYKAQTIILILGVHGIHFQITSRSNKPNQ